MSVVAVCLSGTNECSRCVTQGRMSVVVVCLSGTNECSRCVTVRDE